MLELGSHNFRKNRAHRNAERLTAQAHLQLNNPPAGKPNYHAPTPSLVQALAGPAVPSRPERASRTGGALVIDAFFMGAADNLIGHDNRLGSGPRYECQHFFRHPDVVAD